MVSLTVAGLSDDELRDLAQWLNGDADFRGRIEMIGSGPRSGELGELLEALSVIVAPGGVMAVFASLLIAWIRRRSGNVCIRITGSKGGKVELSAPVKTLTSEELRSTIDDLTRRLSEI